jgi:photosystem II stability/assembly factor-like uncharacterized protein
MIDPLSVGLALALVSPSSFDALHWREIGPLRGGRTVAVAGVADDIRTYYIAQVNGGIWKSDDAGRTWKPIFDAQDTGSIGALAVAPSNSNVIYAGSGEGLQRPDLAIGDGMYKSVDAGKTWTHLGLRDAQQIASIAVDPRNAERAYVAVLGHPYGPNTTRGIYRTTDGGQTWQRVLFKDENTGAFSVALDPQRPDVVFATLWSARQAPWEIGSSFEIPQSGVFKSSDGGTIWAPLTGGLPEHIGRSWISVAPSNSNVVYVYADSYRDAAPGGAVYRSDDGGAHFTLTSKSPPIAERGDDLATLGVDPQNPNVVYVTNTSTYRSRDGGKTFVAFKGAPGGDDYHSIWINPKNPDVLLLGADQGATLSLNGGRTWSSWYNQPTAQMYHVSTDNRFPYWVCGGQQESGSACVASRGDWGMITQRDWHTVGAQEYGYVAADPLRRGVFFGGKLQRFDEATGQTQDVSPIALRADKTYRAVRSEPVIFSRTDPHVLYFATNVIFATRDGGQNWKAISPDLTRKHPQVPSVLGPFAAADPAKGLHRGVVYALAPSYVHGGTLWAGTDDGLVWITRDGGAHWANITPPELTPWSKISQIDIARNDDGTAYVSVNRLRLDDTAPYVYRTRDGGAHWERIVDGLPQQPVNAVRIDPIEPRLLYAATENGVFVSYDEGAHWQSLQLDLPHTSVRDVVVHQNDLVIATHGRGFWILDDVEPLRELARATTYSSPHLFAPEIAYRLRRSTNTDTPLPPEEPSGENPPDGAIIDYVLPAAARTVSLAILDSSGHIVRVYRNTDTAPPPIENLDKPTYWERSFRRLPSGAGMHRWVWDLREPAPQVRDRDLPISAVCGDTPSTPEGPLLPPGLYTVRLTVDGHASQQPLLLRMDPRVAMSGAQLREQYTMAHEIVALLERAPQGSALDDRLRAMLETIDGVDAPVTASARAAFNDVTQGAAGPSQSPDQCP